MLFSELSVPQTGPFLVYCDSQAAIHIVRNLVLHEHMKHFEVDCHFVRTKLQEGLITLRHIATTA